MNWLARLLWAALALLLFCFALLAVNQGEVALTFLSWRTPEISVFWWLLLAFLAGALASGLIFGIAAVRLRLRQRSLARQLENTRRELEAQRQPATVR